MTKVSKVLVVLTAVASLVFLGVVIVNFIGGPNWEAEAAELDGYLFEQSTGENPTWSVKTRRGRAGAGGEVAPQTLPGSTPVLAEAIVKARQDWATQQQQQLEQLNQQIPVLQTRLKEAQDAITADIEAMKQREAVLHEQLLALQKTIDETTQQAIATAEEAERIRDEAARRREDVLRLQNQLAELRTDRYRAEDQQKKLEDLLVRVNGDIGRLERRKEQLQEAGAKLPDSAYPAPEAKPEEADENAAKKNAA